MQHNSRPNSALRLQPCNLRLFPRATRSFPDSSFLTPIVPVAIRSQIQTRLLKWVRVDVVLCAPKSLRETVLSNRQFRRKRSRMTSLAD
eukprot:1184068-Prorocentrum_minimum.AAC.1